MFSKFPWGDKEIEKEERRVIDKFELVPILVDPKWSIKMRHAKKEPKRWDKNCNLQQAQWRIKSRTRNVLPQMLGFPYGFLVGFPVLFLFPVGRRSLEDADWGSLMPALLELWTTCFFFGCWDHFGTSCGKNLLKFKLFELIFYDSCTTKIMVLRFFETPGSLIVEIPMEMRKIGHPRFERKKKHVFFGILGTRRKLPWRSQPSMVVVCGFVAFQWIAKEKICWRFSGTKNAFFSKNVDFLDDFGFQHFETSNSCIGVSSSYWMADFTSLIDQYFSSHEPITSRANEV